MGNSASAFPSLGYSLPLAPASHDANAVPNAVTRVTDTLQCGNTWPGWGGVRHLFTFGDSYTQTGFSVKGTQPSVGNPLGNPPYP